jgi:hypothetical protein
MCLCRKFGLGKIKREVDFAITENELILLVKKVKEPMQEEPQELQEPEDNERVMIFVQIIRNYANKLKITGFFLLNVQIPEDIETVRSFGAVTVKYHKMRVRVTVKNGFYTVFGFLSDIP